MNLGIYRSWHALVALAVIAAFAAWHMAAPREFGSRDDANVLFLLTSGWIAVTCYAVLALYAVRRAAHRLRLSPEFAWKAKLPELERTQSQLRELQNRVDRREITGSAAIQREAKSLLRQNGVARVLRVALENDPSRRGLPLVRVSPREPIGRLAAWLHAHIFYGFAAALVVWFHGGFRCGSTMGLCLNALSYLVIGSGLVGALLWTFGPTWLTRAERELSIEKAFALREHYERKLAEAKERGPDDVEYRTLRGQQAAVARELGRLEKFRSLLRSWRLLHVPCSVLLLALVAVHVISIYYY